MQETSRKTVWRFDSSVLYHSDLESRRRLIAHLILIIKEKAPRSGYHRYLITHLSSKTHADLDEIMQRCETELRKIQIEWPMCYPSSIAGEAASVVSSKVIHHHAEYLAGNTRADQYGAVVLYRISPYRS